MFGTNTSTFPTFKIDLSDHLFIKDYIFKVDVDLPPRGTPIVIVTQYCEHYNMSYISQSTNNSPWNYFLPSRNGTNVFILVVGRKEPTKVQQFLEAISSQKLTVKLDRVHVITTRIDKEIIRTSIQENRCIFNQIIHIQSIGNKLISITTKPPTLDQM